MNFANSENTLNCRRALHSSMCLKVKTINNCKRTLCRSTGALDKPVSANSSDTILDFVGLCRLTHRAGRWYQVFAFNSRIKKAIVEKSSLWALCLPLEITAATPNDAYWRSLQHDLARYLSQNRNLTLDRRCLDVNALCKDSKGFCDQTVLQRLIGWWCCNTEKQRNRFRYVLKAMVCSDFFDAATTTIEWPMSRVDAHHFVRSNPIVWAIVHREYECAEALVQREESKTGLLATTLWRVQAEENGGDLSTEQSAHVARCMADWLRFLFSRAARGSDLLARKILASFDDSMLQRVVDYWCCSEESDCEETLLDCLLRLDSWSNIVFILYTLQCRFDIEETALEHFSLKLTQTVTFDQFLDDLGATTTTTTTADTAQIIEMAMRVGGERWFAPWHATVRESCCTLKKIKQLQGVNGQELTRRFLAAYEAERRDEILNQSGCAEPRKRCCMEEHVFGLVRANKRRKQTIEDAK